MNQNINLIFEHNLFVFLKNLLEKVIYFLEKMLNLLFKANLYKKLFFEIRKYAH